MLIHFQSFFWGGKIKLEISAVTKWKEGAKKENRGKLTKFEKRDPISCFTFVVKIKNTIAMNCRKRTFLTWKFRVSFRQQSFLFLSPQDEVKCCKSWRSDLNIFLPLPYSVDKFWKVFEHMMCSVAKSRFQEKFKLEFNGEEPSSTFFPTRKWQYSTGNRFCMSE